MSLYQRILVPVDGSPTSEAGIDEAARIAKQSGAQLRLLHVVQDPPYSRIGVGYVAFSDQVVAHLHKSGEAVLAAAHEYAARQGVQVESTLLDAASRGLGEHVAAVAREWQADLVVLGTHGRRGVDHLLMGSGAEKVLRAVTVPVLLVRESAS